MLQDVALSSNLAVTWSGTSASWMPLTSGAGTSGNVLGIWNGIQAGDFGAVAAIWHGTPESRVDLAPPGATYSQALAVRAGVQAGIVEYGVGHPVHATAWYGTASSTVDLHPASAVRSHAYATDGVLQGGSVEYQSGVAIATLWNGTAASLMTIGLSNMISAVWGMAPGIQVGYVFGNGATHAAIWRGTAQSLVDFNGPEDTSRLYATTGRIHVGSGAGPGVGVEHAMINFGRPDAWLDLHQFLPSNYTSFSRAYAVYQDGPTIYVGGHVLNPQTNYEAFLWSGPDPCYANCDQSTTPPTLNVLDFVCFLNAFAAGEGYANCDQSTTPPVLNILDFVCFINRFAAGCP